MVGLKHMRNGSNGSGAGLIPAIMENMGLFDSGGTNDSNQQKGHFFENRYAPDDEVEVEILQGGHTQGSPGFKAKVSDMLLHSQIPSLNQPSSQSLQQSKF